ncbi:nudix hydrolase 26, chloroplastic-like isoform X3 [Olea europaea var. sylvestris]|uniref:nudix hydrolase 26, chloroplastic-like isoform X3 n=1 Tax=Olea europaea var. sylvestris TaxID=158386 RepID=UPI000C1D0146|nr:nudix hydrolase 26, chloroplastic-like isoform X3 [Olea europaea var. sylvestris]
MARCFIQFHSPFSRSLLRRTSANTNILFFPYCPPKAHKFTPSLLHHKIPGVAFSSLSSLSSMENPPQGYRKNVGICLMNPSKKGGIDENEDPKSAAIRELREETGVSSAYIIAEVPHWLTYDFPPDVREKLRHQWGSDWKGQAQKWFLFKFTGNDEEINLLGDGTEKPEFGEWSWLSPEEIINLVVDFKKPVYQEVMTVFSPHLEQNIEKVDF